MSGTLVLVRHGQSEWNLKNLFTGWKDPGLTELGVEEAKTGARR
jgi:2,3-bisphosphoglycerate-dependent phosphoglycerate mutase